MVADDISGNYSEVYISFVCIIMAVDLRACFPFCVRAAALVWHTFISIVMVITVVPFLDCYYTFDLVFFFAWELNLIRHRDSFI